jgi:RNA recognition motif-containing protein
MGTKLYVGNLSYATNEEALRAVFGGDGRHVQNVSIIIDRETGRSRGFAFVQMGSPEEAQAAMAALDGHEVAGRPLRVTEAREREPGGRDGVRDSPRNGVRDGGPRPIENRAGPLPPRGNPRERVAPREQGPDSERRPAPRDVRGGNGAPGPAMEAFPASEEDREKAARGRSRSAPKRRDGGEHERADDDADGGRGRGRGRDRDWRRDWDL